MQDARAANLGRTETSEPCSDSVIENRQQQQQLRQRHQHRRQRQHQQLRSELKAESHSPSQLQSKLILDSTAAKTIMEQQQCQQHKAHQQHEQCHSESRVDNYDKSSRRRRCVSSYNEMDIEGNGYENDDKQQEHYKVLMKTATTTSAVDGRDGREHSCRVSESEFDENSSNSSSSVVSNKTRRHLATMEYLQQVLQQQQQILLLQKQHEMLLLQQQQADHNNEANTQHTKGKQSTSASASATPTSATSEISSTRNTNNLASLNNNNVEAAGNLSAAAAAVNFYQQLANAAVAAAADMGAVAADVNALKIAPNPVQITSIDGFFNRKRGRPPKNRFVEVYKNTQQSPQAIFTSFKLEKHGINSGISHEHITKMDHSTSTTTSIIKTTPTDSEHSMDANHNDQYQQQLLQNLPIANKAINYQTFSPSATNKTAHLRFYNQEVESVVENSSTSSQIEAISNSKQTKIFNSDIENNKKIATSSMTDALTSETLQLLRYDRFFDDDYDCHMDRCRLRRIHPHLHCKNCRQQVSPLDLKSHMCNESSTRRQVKQCTANVSKRNNNEELEKCEKISVVRAAGTFYPENSTGNKQSIKTSTITTAANNSDNDSNLKATNNEISSGNSKLTPAPQNYRHKRRRVETSIADICDKITKSNVNSTQKKKCSSNANVDIDYDADMPQDLSINATVTASAKTPTASRTESPKIAVEFKQKQHQPEHEHPGLPLEQLFNLYQQQQQQILYGAAGLPAYPFISQALQQLQTPLSVTPGATSPSLLSDISGLLPNISNPLSVVASFLETFNSVAKKQQHSLLANTAVNATAESQMHTSDAANAATTLTRQQRSNTSAAGLLHKLKDDRIPTGYLKFRFNEDCAFPKCGYRNHQSHFHCNRLDCHYSFCDKTRFVQHTARHERLDTLMGDDFLQYRANMSCGYEKCPYAHVETPATDATGTCMKKSSHFHCRKCDFICSDTNKVVAHRRLHNKMEYIRLAGFRKVASNENCKQTQSTSKTDHLTYAQQVNDEELDLCPYSMKHTHYHCLVCDCSVLSRAQLATHKHKMATAAASATAKVTSTVTTSA